MKLKTLLVLFVFLSGIWACDNEVDLASDFEDTTVVYGLINASADTQFIRINRAFLEENTSALTLAQDADRLFYDELTVGLKNLSTGESFPLSTIEKPKEPGVFSNEKNILYFTDKAIFSNNNYRIEITQPNGKTTFAEALALDTMEFVRPQIDNLRVRPLPLTNSSGSILDYRFQFSHSDKVAEFEVILYLTYTEVLPGGSRVPKSIPINVGKVINDGLVANSEATIDFSGRRFYQTIANAIDPSNQNPKLVDPQNNIAIEIFAADEQYSFYADVYGPIDGLAQVRPEYTNIENGIGLFASRSRSFARTFLTDPSRQQLRTGSITGNLNFQDL
jgi:hypothetical protein